MLVERDLRVRYKNTWAGFAWSLINPALQVAVMTVVLKFVLRVDIQNYSMYLFCAFLPWSFFQWTVGREYLAAFQRAADAKGLLPPRGDPTLTHHLEPGPPGAGNPGLLRDPGRAAVLLVAVTHVFVWTLQPTALLVPIAIVIELLLVTGLAFFVSALNLFYEDVRYLLTVGLSMLYYAVPVLYFAEFLLTTDAIGLDGAGRSTTSTC